MAFPVPSHLPRKKNQDVSTKLLTEISETTFKSLSQEVASKWVAELDVSIRQTKVCVSVCKYASEFDLVFAGGDT